MAMESFCGKTELNMLDILKTEKEKDTGSTLMNKKIHLKENGKMELWKHQINFLK